MEEDDYWNLSMNESFSFDDVEQSPQVKAYHSDRIFENTDENTGSESESYLITSDMPFHLIINPEDLKDLLEEQSTQEVPLPRTITLEEEVKVLRRHLQDSSVSLAISKLMIGKPCSLEKFRSLREKEDLLDEAIQTGAGILQVVLFLQRTLKKKHFWNILSEKPKIAVDHYINFLSTRRQLVECTELLIHLGRSHEAALIQFEVASCTSSSELKKQKLKKIYSDYFSQSGATLFYSNMVANYINLLELQFIEKMVILDDDSSVLETLFYLCSKFKWSDSTATSNALNNPYKMMELYQVLPAQFEYLAVTERGKCQAWRDIVGLFEKKSFLKQNTFTMNCPLDAIILQLHKLLAPQPVLNTFLGNVDDPHLKIELARKVNCPKSIIDALEVLKDKVELENYKSKMPEKSNDYFYAENALKNLISKNWKIK